VAQRTRVRCIGYLEQGDQVTLTECDWKGYRAPGAIQVGPDAYDTRLFPCPRCGGKVVLAQ
jgi:hypothetical protein